MSEPVLSKPINNLNMDDHRIGFVCLDVAAAPTGGENAAPHHKYPTQPVPTILVEDTSEESHLPICEQEGSMNKVFIYLAGDKRNKGFIRHAGPIDPHISAQLAERIATATKGHGILTVEQKAQLGKIVVQKYSTESATVHFLGRSKKLLRACQVCLNIVSQYDNGKETADNMPQSVLDTSEAMEPEGDEHGSY